MPTPIIDLVEQYRRQLLRREREAATRLVNAYGAIYQRLQSEIDALNAELVVMENITPGKVRRMARYRSLLAQVEAELNAYGQFASVEVSAATRQAIEDAISNSRNLVLAGTPPAVQAAVSVNWNALPTGAIEALLSFLAPGSPLHDGLVNQLGPTVAQAVGDALLQGLALGFNPRKVASIIRRTLGQSLTWALRTARTAQLWAYREATRANYVANSDVVGGWMWHAQLDERTCASCIAQHGTIYPNTETLNDHHNGRCAMVPVTRSWRDLGIDIDDVPIGVNPGDGRRWLESQPESVQRSVFGNDALWRAWQDGAVSWDDLSREHDDAVYGPMRSVPSLKELLGENADRYYARNL